MTETILDESAVSEIEKRIDSFPLSPLQARVLCATVKHLWAELAQHEGIVALYQTYIEGMGKLLGTGATDTEVETAVRDLQSQLEQLRAENERLRNTRNI